MIPLPCIIGTSHADGHRCWVSFRSPVERTHILNQQELNVFLKTWRVCVSEIGQWHTSLVNTLIPSKIVTDGTGRLREGVKGFLNITMSSILHEVYFTYHKIQPLYMSNSMIFFQ